MAYGQPLYIFVILNRLTQYTTRWNEARATQIISYIEIVLPNFEIAYLRIVEIEVR
ncbi:MAG: hypothetical protein SAMD01599839_18440 [Rectinema sp.]